MAGTTTTTALSAAVVALALVSAQRVHASGTTCVKGSRDGYYEGLMVKPGGEKPAASWQVCAAMCAHLTACQVWALRVRNTAAQSGTCIMKSSVSTFVDTGPSRGKAQHFNGIRDEACKEMVLTTLPPATVPGTAALESPLGVGKTCLAGQHVLDSTHSTQGKRCVWCQGYTYQSKDNFAGNTCTCSLSAM